MKVGVWLVETEDPREGEGGTVVVEGTVLKGVPERKVFEEGNLAGLGVDVGGTVNGVFAPGIREPGIFEKELELVEEGEDT